MLLSLGHTPSAICGQGLLLTRRSPRGLCGGRHETGERRQTGENDRFGSSAMCCWTRSLKTLSARSPSTAFRERERQKAVLGGIWRPNRATSSTSYQRGEMPRRRPQTPGEAQKRPRLRASQNGERRFHLVKMVEAVGIEPTSDGQSPRAATSVACVLLSPSITPTGRLDAGLVRAFSPPPYEPRGSGKLAGVCAQADLASPIGRTSPR